MRYADAAVGVALFAVGVAWLGAALPGTSAREGPYVVGIGLVALQALPVLARRRFPMIVLLAVMTGSVIYGAFAFPPSPIDVAEPLALYTVALYRRPRALALGGCAVLVSLALTWAASPFWYGGMLELASVGIFFVLVALAGAHQRSRRKLVARQAVLESELARARAEQAVAEERVALARELHDAVGHAQTVVLFHAGVARMTFDSDPVRSRRALEVVEERSRATLEEMQLLVDSLRNNAENQRAILPTLADLDSLIGMASDVGLEVSLTREGMTRQIPAAVEVSAYRIVQEALTNVVRHAQARHVSVALCYRDQELRIDVRNDEAAPGDAKGGPLAEPGRTRKPRLETTQRWIGGKGLLGMRERATSLGGRLEAKPDADGGFVVTAWLPLPAAPVASELSDDEPTPDKAFALIQAPREPAQRGRAG